MQEVQDGVFEWKDTARRAERYAILAADYLTRARQHRADSLLDNAVRNLSAEIRRYFTSVSSEIREQLARSGIFLLARSFSHTQISQDLSRDCQALRRDIHRLNQTTGDTLTSATLGNAYTELVVKQYLAKITDLVTPAVRQDMPSKLEGLLKQTQTDLASLPGRVNPVVHRGLQDELSCLWAQIRSCFQDVSLAKNGIVGKMEQGTLRIHNDVGKACTNSRVAYNIQRTPERQEFPAKLVQGGSKSRAIQSSSKSSKWAQGPQSSQETSSSAPSPPRRPKVTAPSRELTVDGGKRRRLSDQVLRPSTPSHQNKNQSLADRSKTADQHELL